jgi:hypothetical protein
VPWANTKVKAKAKEKAKTKTATSVTAKTPAKRIIAGTTSTAAKRSSSSAPMAYVMSKTARRAPSGTRTFSHAIFLR